MMVLFTSMSDKKARKTTRWILDAFAERIGQDTWQTAITEDGLKMVYKLLRRHATKSMSVSCRWIRSHTRSQLLWIVGDRSRFNAEGNVPVNATLKELQHQEWENAWGHLPQIKALAGVAGLLHDWGKCNDAFQDKLKTSKKGTDPYRHEWISCRLIAGLVLLSGDKQSDAWIPMLLENRFQESDLMEVVKRQIQEPLSELPPIASMLCWLILSHHRMPVRSASGYEDVSRDSFNDVMDHIDASWGYERDSDEIGTVSFQHGLLADSSPWRKSLEKWLSRLLDQKDALLTVWQTPSMRPLLLYARLSLMLGDYFVSSCDADERWKGNTELFANTYHHELKQKLDEHLVRVSKEAVQIAHFLPAFEDKMPVISDASILRRKSPEPYTWQDKAVRQIQSLYNDKTESCGEKGFFIVNMASTGCGKTFANAKIMQALSSNHKSLRYVLTLGLRTLTLQTGDEYRRRIRLSSDEMAVLIGSAAIRRLHEEDQDEWDTAYQESLYDGILDGDFPEQDEFLDVFFSAVKQQGKKDKKDKKDWTKKNKQLLYQPVLVATIDHMMPATETIRGGRYMLPLLRLMSSDLVIDEVDDFGPSDLQAIARLVHLAGMLGRNVVISSATIPPDLAKGLFAAYRSGRACWAAFFKKRASAVCFWCDEFQSQGEVFSVTDMEWDQGFHMAQQKFLVKRIDRLNQLITKRKGSLISCAEALEKPSGEERRKAYFYTIQQAVIRLHASNCCKDAATGKQVSIGLIRMANIKPCTALGKYLLEADWPADIEPRIMVYHSQQVLLLRHEQERYLDRVLHRKGDYCDTVDFQDPILRHIIDTTSASQVIFLVVSTPVEEVGRDHDFDWAIIEPSSYRSFIQLSGRVLRHRRLVQDIGSPNVGILQYNYKGLMDASGKKVVFHHPGFETEQYRLVSHDLAKLVDESMSEGGLDAIPRIRKAVPLSPHTRLADLEQQVMQDFGDLSTHGAAVLHGWLEEYWYLTGIPQKLNPFRASYGNIELYLSWNGKGWEFQERDERTGEYVCRTSIYGITMGTEPQNNRFWLSRDYAASIRQRWEAESNSLEDSMHGMENLCHRYGGLTIPIYPWTQTDRIQYRYSDQFGIYQEI